MCSATPHTLSTAIYKRDTSCVSGLSEKIKKREKLSTVKTTYTAAIVIVDNTAATEYTALSESEINIQH